MARKSPEAVRYVHPKCSSGKLGWESRKGAKQFNTRIVRGGGDCLAPYECDECGYWHLGHLPRAVREGTIGRTDFYAPKATVPTIEPQKAPNSHNPDRRAA
jgi:hypothetical protein